MKPKARPRAYLLSAGYPKENPTYTHHTFVDSRLEPDPKDGWLHPQWGLYYKCNTTGAERKFGVIDATEITEREQATEEGLV